MSKTAKILLIFAAIAVLFTVIGRGIWNKNMWYVQKIDDRTRYSTMKKVEDTCRAMVASYTSDKVIFEMYQNSTDKREKELSDQARIRANKTAATYNEYILKNSYVWDGNIPRDIYAKLEFI